MEKLKIILSITEKKDQIHFNIKNTSNPVAFKSNGIGLDNIKKRLELVYKNNYSLNITEENAFYDIHLILNTTSNFAK